MNFNVNFNVLLNKYIVHRLVKKRIIITFAKINNMLPEDGC